MSLIRDNVSKLPRGSMLEAYKQNNEPVDGRLAMAHTHGASNMAVGGTQLETSQEEDHAETLDRFMASVTDDAFVQNARSFMESKWSLLTSCRPHCADCIS